MNARLLTDVKKPNMSYAITLLDLPDTTFLTILLEAYQLRPKYTFDPTLTISD